MNTDEKKLIEENINVIKGCVRRFMNVYNIPLYEYEDYYQVACLTVCNKVNKYDGTTKFSTFINVIIKNAFIDMYRADKKKYFEMIYMEDCLNEDDEGKAEKRP